MDVEEKLNLYQKNVTEALNKVPDVASKYDGLNSSSLFIILGLLIGGSIGGLISLSFTFTFGLGGMIFGALCFRGLDQIKLERTIKKYDLAFKFIHDKIDDLPENCSEIDRQKLYQKYFNLMEKFTSETSKYFDNSSLNNTKYLLPSEKTLPEKISS